MVQPDRVKIITLWGVFLLGLLFHTQLALMPLFHGLPVNDAPAARSIETRETSAVCLSCQ